MESITHYQRLAYQQIALDAPIKQTYFEIDEINDCVFELPGPLQKLSWLKGRKFVSIAPKNALQGAIRTFAAHIPNISIAPGSEEQGEWDRVSMLERAVEWNLEQLYRRGDQSALWKIIESAMKHCAVAFQTEYLPYTTAGKVGAKYDDLRRKGAFSWVVHPWTAVHPRTGKHGLESVLLAYMRTVQDIIDEFGLGNPGVVKLLSKLQTDYPRASWIKVNVQFYDYTDYSDRVIWVTMAGERANFDNIEEPEPFILVKEEHGMGFINWVIVDNKEPILKPLVDGQIWKNANILNTIEQSMYIALAAHPRYWTNTTSGTGVNIDFDSPLNPMDLKPGETAGTLDSPTIDEGLRLAVANIEQQIYESTASRVLSSAETLAEKGTAFSTINAIVQLSIAQLELSRSTAERAIEDGIYQMFRWIVFSTLPLITRVARPEPGKLSRIAVLPEPLAENAGAMEVGFKMDDLYITAKLEAQTLVDESGRINNAILKYEKLGQSRATSLEEVGVKHPEHEMQARELEELRWLSIQAQALQDPQDMRNKNNAQVFGNAKGVNTAGGGVTAQQYAPSTTREKVTGKSQGGDDVA